MYLLEKTQNERNQKLDILPTSSYPLNIEAMPRLQMEGHSSSDKLDFGL